MGVLTVQNSFTHGQFSEKMLARTDIALYNKAAKQLENVIVLAQGGVKRRFGTTFIDDLADRTAADLSLGQYKLVPFLLSEEVDYLLVFVDDEIIVYENESYVHTIPATGITGAQIADIEVAQSNNLLIIVHPDFNPKQLVRGANSTTWSLTIIDFVFVPGHDFSRGAAYANSTFTLSSSAVGTSTLTVAGGFQFTDAYVGGYFSSLGETVLNPLGFAQITSRTSPTQVEVNIISPFKSTFTSETGANCVVAEKAWSDLEADGSGNRGWPISLTFYQDRLYFGGSRSLPNFLFGSKISLFNNFDIGNGLADDALIYELGANTIADIKYLVADRSLQIFTSQSEWSIPQEYNDAITPSTISIRKQTNFGISDVAPVILDNVTFFVKRGGKGIMEYVYSDDNFSYRTEDISIVFSDLVRNPVDMAVLRANQTEDGEFLLAVNDDGTLLVYQTLRIQEVQAASLAVTSTADLNNEPIQANFKRVENVQDKVYFLVERIIGGVTKYYIEILDFDVFMDCNIEQTFNPKTDIITGLEKLANSSVDFRGDGFAFPTQQVNSLGRINLISDVPETLVQVSNAQAGFAFQPTIIPVPIILETQQGATNFVPKRVNRVFINYFESLGIEVDGVQIPNFVFDDTFTTQTLTPSYLPQTANYQLYKAGWDITPFITITQTKPLPMTILSVGYEVEV